jgi:hypothetical protein
MMLRHLPRRQFGLLPALESYRPRGRSCGTERRDCASAHIAAFAERHTHDCPPARKIASRSARCAGVHLPDRDFSSMPINFPRYKTSTSGMPGLTRRAALADKLSLCLLQLLLQLLDNFAGRAQDTGVRQLGDSTINLVFQDQRHAVTSRQMLSLVNILNARERESKRMQPPVCKTAPPDRRYFSIARQHESTCFKL